MVYVHTRIEVYKDTNKIILKWKKKKKKDTIAEWCYDLETCFHAISHLYKDQALLQ